MDFQKALLEQQSLKTISYKWIVFGINRWEFNTDAPIQSYDKLAEGDLNIKCRATAEETVEALQAGATRAIGKGEIYWGVDQWYHFWIDGVLRKTHINPLRNHYKANVSENFGQEAEARIFLNQVLAETFHGMSEGEIRAIPKDWLSFLQRSFDKLQDHSIPRPATQIIVDYLLNNLANF